MRGRQGSAGHPDRHVPWRMLALAAAVIAACCILLLPRIAAQQPAQGSAAQDGSSGEASDELAQEASGILQSSASSLPDGVASDDVESYEVARPLRTAAASLMKEYQDRSDCILLEARYLDLLGSIWGFSVEGQGWVDVCIMRDAGASSTAVEIVHLRADGQGG